VLLESSFDTPPLLRKNHNGIKSFIAPILPLARPTRAGRGCDIARTVTEVTATNRQPFKKHATRVSIY
jgi:hypothetical protein